MMWLHPDRARSWPSLQAIGRQELERGLRPELGRCLRLEQRVFGNLMVFALMLMVVFLSRARAGSAIRVFFPVGEPRGPDWRDYVTFFGIGSAVGSIFALIVFAAAATADDGGPGAWIR